MITTTVQLLKRMTKVQRKAWYRRYDEHCPYPHLALTAKERKFARRTGWNLCTLHNSFRAKYEWFCIRPDGTSCGFLCAYKEIRRARTLSFLPKIQTLCSSQS